MTVDLTAKNAFLHDAAANSLAFQETAAKQEAALRSELAALEAKLRQTEARCVELLQLKMGQEKDIRRLRNEATSLAES